MPNRPAPDKQRIRNSKEPQTAADLLHRIKRQNFRESDQNQGLEPPNVLLIRLQKLLPSDLAEHLKQVRQRDEELVVFSISSAWAARLQMAISDILTNQKDAGLSDLSPIKRVQGRVLSN
jgi:hypothetical protein